MAIVEPLLLLLEAYRVVVFVSIIASWIQSDNVVFNFAHRLTEPVLAPIRRFLPPAGGFDLSPVVLIIGLSLLRAVLTGL